MSEWARKHVEPMPKASDGRPFAFHDLTRDDFPFRVEAHDEETGELLWQETVDGPGVLHIPAQGRERKVRVTTSYPRKGYRVTVASDGTTTEEDDHG